MTGGDPTWLKIVLGLIPLLAALIAGVVALTNTLNRRIERFKLLVEIQKDYPEMLNPGNMLEEVILRELFAIDRANDPAIRGARQIYVTAAVLIVLGYIDMLLNLGASADWWVFIAGAALVVIGSVLFLVNRHQGRKLRDLQDRYLKAAIDFMHADSTGSDSDSDSDSDSGSS
jgi:hypothetical protein